MIEAKTKGREITILPRAPARSGVIDLMEALKESMRTVQRGKNPAEQKKRKKA
jgi:non-homologous end joining protein Ku